MKLLRNTGFSGLLVEYKRNPSGSSHRARNPGRSLLRVARARLGRQGIQARGLPRWPSRTFVGEPTGRYRGHRHPAQPAAGLESRSPARVARKTGRAPQRFTVENLQKAHEIRHKKSLVDIISMVKHAADEQSPLLTAAERVERAFTQHHDRSDIHRRAAAMAGSHPDPPARRTSPSTRRISTTCRPFRDYGGWGKAVKVFQGRATAAHQTNSIRQLPHERHRPKTLGLLPYPAPRRRGLWRLHRAAHLPAFPEDGGRARHRPHAVPWQDEKGNTRRTVPGPACEKIRHRASPTITPTSCASSRDSPACSATSSPRPRRASTIPSTSSAHRHD